MYEQPTSLETACALLAEGGWVILSGGTDYYPSLGDGKPTDAILDVSRLEDLQDITEDDEFWSIGALVTWTDIIKADLPSAFDALKLAAHEVGSIQVQNRATVVGNICNASPAADGMPPLLVLDTTVQLSSANGVREMHLGEFVTGNRTTELRSNEMVTHLKIPKQSANGVSTFRKLGSRRYLVISISMVAVRLVIDGQSRITDAAVAIGACSAVAKRLVEVEALLIGRTLTPDLAGGISVEHFSKLSPIDDIRSSASYRLEASAEIVRRAIFQLAAET